VATFRQLIKFPRKQRCKKKLSSALKGAPQLKGLCMKIYTMSPKKPNSARRKVVRVKLSTKKFVLCYVPGEGHNLNSFNHVLVQGGRTPDLPGVRYSLIRGVYDLKGVIMRRHGRSKYGFALNKAVLEYIKFPRRPPMKIKKGTRQKPKCYRSQRETLIY
jgi:small subunit ribosomal protein S12